MIPKKIYYIWIGNAEKPPIFQKCYDSWVKLLSDYEIIEINESNFNMEEHLSKNSFFRACYERKMWAFVSDYIRVHYLYDNGGIYLDIDMEIIKSFSPLLNSEMSFFSGYEDEINISCGIIGAEKKCAVLGHMIDFYKQEIWEKPIFTIPKVLTYILEKNYKLSVNREQSLQGGEIQLYPKQYFYPFGLREKFTPACIQEDTYGIHWWNDSWGDIRNYMFLRTKHMKGVRKRLFELLFYMKHYKKFRK